jgi:hypothetical protein
MMLDYCLAGLPLNCFRFLPVLKERFSRIALGESQVCTSRGAIARNSI